ncbi:hypothetical protein GCU67_04390 [Modestobacter muralis]|uniref:Uncharacterized protein n=1 Tax=Modestobacter muralis TaxID=1608614 RepID=A0A6P0H3I2_9ACTN|nr:hypothetical protein [Modestobacter muralis]NEK93415.1 hypothetical protein [Modestobacter muralis]NEN50182.1 hypothetical protein [Modestobacter muralis]
MRAPATLLKAGLTATAALVLLTACGGSEDEATDAAAASAPTSSSAASSSPAATGSSATASGGSDDPAVQAFCDQAGQALTQVSQSLASPDAAQVAPALEKAVTDLEAVQVPAEISGDWDAAKELFAGLRDAVSGVDLNTQEGQAAVQAEATRLQAETGEAQARLDAWTKENCAA